ncbi:unnamed protein product, partial [Staurois parvus]
MLLKAWSCNALPEGKVLPTLCSLEPSRKSEKENAKDFLLSNSLNAATYPIGLESIVKNHMTNKKKVNGLDVNGGLDWIIHATIPRIVIIPTSESSISEGPEQPADNEIDEKYEKDLDDDDFFNFNIDTTLL